MKKIILWIVVLVVILLLLGVSTGFLGVHIVLHLNLMASYWNVLLGGIFSIVGGELLKVVLKKVSD